MLNRFRKQGGFNQLLALIETCDPVKQRNLLHLVGSEDPGWAHLVRSKCLTLDKVMSWPQEILMEITPHLTEKVILALHSGMSLDQQVRFLAALPSSLVRVLQDQLTNPVTLPEQHAAMIKLIQLVRDLEGQGKFKFSSFDPSLVIDPAIAA